MHAFSPTIIDPSSIRPNIVCDWAQTSCFSDKNYLVRLGTTIDTETTAPIILQASARTLAGYGCVVAQLAFRAYCSQFYKYHGQVLSDDVALHHLSSGINSVRTDPGCRLDWLTAPSTNDYSATLKDDFWINVCKAYLAHVSKRKSGEYTETSTFALSFVMHDQKSRAHWKWKGDQHHRNKYFSNILYQYWLNFAEWALTAVVL